MMIASRFCRASMLLSMLVIQSAAVRVYKNSEPPMSSELEVGEQFIHPPLGDMFSLVETNETLQSTMSSELDVEKQFVYPPRGDVFSFVDANETTSTIILRVANGEALGLTDLSVVNETEWTLRTPTATSATGEDVRFGEWTQSMLPVRYAKASLPLTWTIFIAIAVAGISFFLCGLLCLWIVPKVITIRSGYDDHSAEGSESDLSSEMTQDDSLAAAILMSR
mmetsp:Transcript_32087/g.62746  ORF Transcript_32087/g.62746 Transcript_32087/m.62746 type:complete len:223 (-) Transcript_32087:44-712(-)